MIDVCQILGTKYFFYFERKCDRKAFVIDAREYQLDDENLEEFIKKTSKDWYHNLIKNDFKVHLRCGQKKEMIDSNLGFLFIQKTIKKTE